MTARGVALVIALGGSSLFGCRPRAPELPPPVPVEVEPIRGSLSALESEADAVKRYQGFVRIRGRGPDGGFSGRLVVVFERPDHLRVDLLGAFGSTRWSAIAAGDGITVVFPGPKQYVEEDDIADVVGRLLGVRLDAREVMAMLSGLGVPLEGEPTEAVRRGATRIATMSNGARVELSDDGQIVSVTTPRYRVTYPSQWKASRHVPDTVGLETDTLRATLSPEDVDVNVAIDPEAFVVEIPTGSERLRPSDVVGEAVFVVTRETKQ